MNFYFLHLISWDYVYKEHLGNYFQHFVLQSIWGSLTQFGYISIKAICGVFILVKKCSKAWDCVIIQLTQTTRGENGFGLPAWFTNGL